jgi:hypothetical protein
MFIEHAKQQLLDMMQGLEEVAFSSTPTFFFLTRLREEMRELGLELWIEPTLGSIQINITALGFDAEPHEEWLTAIAKSYAKLIEKMITTFKTFGDEVVRSQLSNLSLKME